MSDLPLSNVQEVVELTIFHSILQELVDKGYAPDIRDTTTYPDTVAGNEAYKAAVEAIILDKGFSVELFNNSNPDYKGQKGPPRIVMITDDPLPGDIGTDRGRVYEAVEGGFSPMIRPPDSYDIQFSVYLVANNAKQHRILVSLLSNALPSRGYMPISPRYDLADFNIFVQNISMSSLPSAIDGLIEKVYRYEVKDIFLTEYIKIFETVSPLTQLNVDIYNLTQRLAELQILLAGLSIAVSANPSAYNDSITFTATPINGGPLPVYTWYRDGVVTGGSGPTLTSSTFSDGNVVSCKMVSSIEGIVNGTAYSNSITLTRTDSRVIGPD